MRLVVRPARLDDVQHYYPGIGASFRAWVAEINGKIEGIVGLVLTRPIACLISTFSEALKPYLRSLPVLKAIKRVRDLCASHNGKIVAMQEPGMPTSPAVLRRMGFRPFGEVAGEMIYEFEGA